MGIIESFKILIKFKKKKDLYSRLKRLIHPTMMGRDFKVFLQKKKNSNFFNI